MSFHLVCALFFHKAHYLNQWEPVLYWNFIIKNNKEPRFMRNDVQNWKIEGLSYEKKKKYIYIYI